ncbi:hypothetical protein [Streptomyces sp. R41]|uniref:Uncharacterized protein n=1 Tax=Streptomyces sp. R41 TaxID=3238632 RepID=A0AB39R886_9ACTN
MTSPAADGHVRVGGGITVVPVAHRPPLVARCPNPSCAGHFSRTPTGHSSRPARTEIA